MKGPKIKHVDTRGNIRIVRNILDNFIKRINEFANNFQLTEIKDALNDVAEDDLNIEKKLLEFRKKLASTIKSGMLDRKDRESEIAFYAAIVWFLRQEKEIRDRIAEEW